MDAQTTIIIISIIGNLIMVADKIVAKTENKYDDLILTAIKAIFNKLTGKNP